MGKKYIVEIGRLERLYKAFVSAHGKPEITWLSPEVDLTPYTEPDLEAIRKEAYEQGRKDGKIEGQAETWVCAKKIAYMDSEERKKIFGENLIQNIHDIYSASEVIEKLKAYEQEKEEQIQVGDEVDAPFGKAIVVNIDTVAEKIWFVYADGRGGFDYFKDAPTKTGRHFPEIAEVLQKMKEANNG